MSDTLMRQWQMLRFVPRHPAKISTSELKQRLVDEGFEVHQRTIQRDLITLSSIYPLTCDERWKPFGWSWIADANIMDIPGMDSHTALAFYLAKEHLEQLLPTSTVKQLQPHFRTAVNVLDSTNSKKGAPAWIDKVRVVHRGPKLKSPTIDSEVQEQVYEALLHNWKLQIRYRPRGEKGKSEYEINPLGLVLKEGVFYLVCTFRDYEDIRLLTLHRILEAKALDIPSDTPEGFDLDHYIASGELHFSLGGMIHLKALFSRDAAFHLEERPLSDDQMITEQEDGRVLIEATVQDTSELRWWLLGYGDNLEVIEPAELRDCISAIVVNLAGTYTGTE
ncbi:MAG: helix-turn-helix transcriptional regulator [Mariprofundus sp.]